MKKIYKFLVSFLALLIIIAGGILGYVIGVYVFEADGFISFLLGLLVGFLFATLTFGRLFIFISMHTHLEKIDATLLEMKKSSETTNKQLESISYFLKSTSSETAAQKENSNS